MHYYRFFYIVPDMTHPLSSNEFFFDFHSVTFVLISYLTSPERTDVPQPSKYASGTISKIKFLNPEISKKIPRGISHNAREKELVGSFEFSLASKERGGTR
jgi:hypothetical protein